jgi:hypothetical protein
VSQVRTARRRRLPRAAAWLGSGCLALLCAVAPAHAGGPISSLSASPDVTTDLAGSVFRARDVVDDDLAGTLTPADLGALPAGSNVVGYHVESNGDRLLAFDDTVSLPGNVVAETRDVVRYDGTTFALVLDGSLEGLPVGVGIDAITRAASGQLVLSFDTTVNLGPITAADEDLVHWSTGGHSLAFDGSSPPLPVPAQLDLDAAHGLDDGRLLLSFDTTGTFAGFPFHDEDLLEFDPATGDWSLAFDASEAVASWPPHTDLDAVALPEPGWLPQLAAGLALLATLGRRRRGPQARPL